MFKRVELHNHSTHSDGTLTVAELLHYADELQFGAMALTDHNTASGHRLAEVEIRQKEYGLELVRGIEVTSMYGHILALGLTQMVDLRLLNPLNPAPFFALLRASGAKAIGAAHPFFPGSPLFPSCRWELQNTNWHELDYIEIFNSAGGNLLASNQQALHFWKDLVFKGYRLACVAGLDLHTLPRSPDTFTTYYEHNDALCAEDAVIGAILLQKTVVSRGPLLKTEKANGQNYLLTCSSGLGLPHWEEKKNHINPLLELCFNTGFTMIEKINETGCFQFSFPENAHVGIPLLYDGENQFKNLLAVGSPVYSQEKNT